MRMRPSPRRLAATVAGLITICFAVLCMAVSVMALIDPADVQLANDSFNVIRYESPNNIHGPRM